MNPIFFIILFAAIVVAVIGTYLFFLCPGKSRKEKLSAFRGKYIAHRGLFNNKDVPENSLPAFENAIKNSFPIELDVQLTKDKRLVVFHDETLSRMCNCDKKISSLTYCELQKLSLLTTDEKIPLFSDTLSLVNGQVPLLIEIKHYEGYMDVTRALAEAMKSYTGAYAVQSFHPKAVAWYKKNEPSVARGLLSTVYKNKKSKPSKNPFPSTLLLNFYARPDFISFNHKYTSLFPYKISKKLYKFESAAWTIRSQKDLDRAKGNFTFYIFDSFMPK